MRNLETICELLYNSTAYPAYLYREEKLAAAFPTDASLYTIPDKYLSVIKDWNKPLLCYQTDFTGFYGYISMPESSSFLVIGPVSSVPYNADMLHYMRTQCFHVQDNQAFEQFITGIPAANIRDFVNLIVLHHYILTGNLIRMDDMIGSEEDFTPLYDNIHQKYLDELYGATNEQAYNSAYKEENQLMSIVEHGEIARLSSYSSVPIPSYPGMWAPNSTDHLKYIANSTINLACRAAIRGGLPAMLAFQVGETYMSQISSLVSSESIGLLISQAVFDLTRRVSSLKINRHSDNLLMDAIRFIQENHTRPLTVSEVADHVGYNRNYLSRKFRKELHFDITSFIRKCRLEHAKELLAYSSKSISEISSYLCFSSQSHFQNTFKKALGMTPLEYRKSENSGNSVRGDWS